MTFNIDMPVTLTCFQRCLSWLHLRSLAFDAFVDAFQGCYKDGTNGTRDCRYFASLNILLRILFVITFCVSRNPTVFFFLIAILLGIYSILFVNAKPYKKSIYSTADSFVMIRSTTSDDCICSRCLCRLSIPTYITNLYSLLPLCICVSASVYIVLAFCTHHACS